MRVFLTTASGKDSGLAVSALRKVEQCAAVDRVGEHAVTSDPDAADILLFIETDQGIGPFGSRLRLHPLVRRMPEKCFVYNSSDHPVAHLPGLYASIDKSRCDPARVKSAHYLSTHITVPERRRSPMAERGLLYSFVGDARNAPVRRRLLELPPHPRGLCVDTSDKVATVWHDPIQSKRFVDDYASVFANTKFALCPRGCGASSMRLFEAMRVGCVPVILSDAWVAPTGPNWAEFAVFVPEADVATLPSLLERLEPSAAARGEAAARTWDEWFSDEMTFHRLVGWCAELKRTAGPSQRSLATWVTLTERLWPRNAAPTLRWLKALARDELRARRAR